MTKLLDVSDLTIAFPRATPVRNLSFSVDEGETVALVGESGSGKSLTALALMRLLPRTARVPQGEVRLNGADLITATDRHMRSMRGREIAMIFQEPMTSLNPVMTIGAQIVEVLRQHERLSRAIARRRAIELLDLVRVPEPHLRIDTFPHQLSGGQRQRVMIAIAVACRPKLLIADEPTTALDVTIQAQVLELLDSLRRDLSMALLLITHDLGVVGEWADRVVVMYAGRTVEEAAHHTLFTRPLHPYTRGLLAASPRLNDGSHYTTSRLVEIPGSISSAITVSGCAFSPRCESVQPVCRASVPPLVALAPGHSVACPIAAAGLAAKRREVTRVALVG